MSKGTNVAASNKTTKGGKNNAPVSQTATTANAVSTEEKSNDAASNDAAPVENTDVATTVATSTESAAPVENTDVAASTDVATTDAASTDAVVPVMTKKMPPMKGKRGGGGGRPANSGKPTYNIAIVSYNDLVVDKDGNLKFVPHIANGNWVPTYNGDLQPGAAPIDKTQPVYDSMEAAIAANAVEFGMKLPEDKMVKIYGFAQNIQLMEAGAPLTGKVHDKDGKKWKKGEPVLYSCFLTATAENYKAVVANLKYYMEHPSTVGNRDIIEMLPAPHQLTYPINVPLTMGADNEENNEENNEEKLEETVA